jgi:hypothetical protein
MAVMSSLSAFLWRFGGVSLTVKYTPQCWLRRSIQRAVSAARAPLKVAASVWPSGTIATNVV